MIDAGNRGRLDESLDRRQRLQRSADFDRVYRGGVSYPSRHLVLFVLRGTEMRRQAGFVAGRRVGPAVERVRAKRVMREAYRKLKVSLPERGVHVVLVARSGCGRIGAEEVHRELATLLARAGYPPPIPPILPPPS